MSGSTRTSSIKVQGYTPTTEDDMAVRYVSGPTMAQRWECHCCEVVRSAFVIHSAPVAVVNETFAEHFFKDQTAWPHVHLRR